MNDERPLMNDDCSVHQSSFSVPHSLLMRSRLTPLVKLFYNPHQAMIELSAGAPYLVGAALALIATFGYYELLSGRLAKIIAAFTGDRSMLLFGKLILLIFNIAKGTISHATPILFIVVVFVPACLLVTSIIHQRASVSVLVQQAYSALVRCAFHSWAAAHFVMMIPAALIYQPGGPNAAALEAALRLVPLPYFVFLIVIAARAVLRISWGAAIGVTALGSLSLLALPLL